MNYFIFFWHLGHVYFNFLWEISWIVFNNLVISGGSSIKYSQLLHLIVSIFILKKFSSGKRLLILQLRALAIRFNALIEND